MNTAEYLESLVIADFEPIAGGVFEAAEALESTVLPPAAPAVVDGGSVISFVAGISAQERRDVLYSVQLAQRGASAAFHRFNQTPEWYAKYSEILSQVGWVGERLAFKEHRQGSGHLEMDKAALEILLAAATGQQLDILTKSFDALRKLSDGDKPLTLFQYNALAQASGNFQLGAVQKGAGKDGPLAMGLGGFYFHADKQEGRILVFSWGGKSTILWAAVEKLTLNSDLYAKHREIVEAKLGLQADDYLSALRLAP